MRRRATGPAELEALDPITGDALSAPTFTGGIGDARRRRLRRLTATFALLATACAAAAGYFALSIAQLRGVERTWRTAMAVDAARADADRAVVARLDEATPGDDEDEAPLALLGAIGTEAASELRRHERRLRDRPIIDSKVSDLRDEMADALEFRRFQLTPNRDRIGDTPLRKVETAIDVQLDRWGLAPSRVDEPRLASLAPALATLRNYADVDTDAVVFALDGTTLHTIDVDASTRHARAVAIGGTVLSVNGGVAVNDGVRVVLYPAEPGTPPFATIEDEAGGGNRAVPAGDGSGDLWVAQAGGSAVRRFRVDGASSGWVTDPTKLPPGRSLVGATFNHLVLESPGRGLELWPSTLGGPVTVLASQGARFLTARGTLVLFQGPLPFSPADSSAFLHRYSVGTGRRDLIGLPRTDAASAALSPQGVAAIAAGPLAGRLGSVLLLEPGATALTGGSSIPRSSVEAQAVAWAADGRALFWLTPDGALAIGHGTRPGVRQLVRTGLRGLDRIAVLGR